MFQFRKKKQNSTYPAKRKAKFASSIRKNLGETKMSTKSKVNRFFSERSVNKR